MSGLAKDATWIRQSFLVEAQDLDEVDFNNRIFSSADLKFVDTTPGGNFCINPPPQFTRSADIRSPGRYFKNKNDSTGGAGLGRYYSEAIDDNSQIIHMRFGVAKFNSMSQFFTGFYNSEASALARTGRSNSFIYKVGQAIGYVVPLLNVKILLLSVAGNALRFATGKQTSKYYYLKPAMPLYWNAVQTIVNHITVNRGITPRVFGKDAAFLSDKYEFTPEATKVLHDLLPEIFSEKGGVDVYAMANRAQRLARRRLKKQQELMNDSSGFNITDKVQQLFKNEENDPTWNVSAERPSYHSYLDKWFSSKPSKLSIKNADAGGSEALVAEGRDTSKDDQAGFEEFLQAELDDGSAFASFRVNSTGSVQESFSNSVTESEIANKINSTSSSSRSTNFSFAGGNISDSAIGKAVGGVINGVADLVKGVADGIGISGIAALAGSAFVDIPKHWQSSSASLPRSTYTINLVSPYGNPISQLLNLHIPLAMLLAAALPLSTGRQSYTSPFLLELYDQGRCQTRLGMIDSLSITRGTGNLGFNADGHAMAIDISFSIIDMSSILHMPITEGFNSNGAGQGLEGGLVAGAVAGTIAGSRGGVGGAVVGGVGGAVVGGAAGTGLGAAADVASNVAKSIDGMFDDDTVFTDYMAVLAGMGLQEQIYQFQRFKLNITLVKAKWSSWASPAQFAGMYGDTMPGRLVSAIYKGVAR